MNDYLTYAALRVSDLEKTLTRSQQAAERIGVRFEVPSRPDPAAHVWVAGFGNGWVFAMADPAVYELLDVFHRISRDDGVPCISGATDGDFSKWSYTYREGPHILHQFDADPSIRYTKDEYPSCAGNASELARIFGVSRIRLQQQMRQFEAASVQDFLETLGFDIRQSGRVRFVLVGPGAGVGPSTLSVVFRAKEDTESSGFHRGATTRAYEQVNKAISQGYGTAAEIKARRFGSDQDYNDAHDLFLRVRSNGHAEVALSIADALIERGEKGDFARLPPTKQAIRMATVHGLRGLALFDCGRIDDAIHALRDKALSINRYMGPKHRASISSTLGECLVRMQRPKDALDPLRLCLSERPLHADTWRWLARAANLSGRRQEARQAVLRGVAADPKKPYWAGVMQEVGVSKRELLPTRNPRLAVGYRRDARRLMRDGRKLQAVEGFRLSLHHDPEDIDCAWGLASAVAECTREGLMTMAKDDFEVVRLLEQVCFGNSAWPWSWGTLIEWFARSGQDRRALEAIDGYARHHVKKVEDLYAVGNWLCGVLPKLGIVTLKILAERFVELRMLQAAPETSRAGALFQVHSSLGRALFKEGDHQQAVKHLSEAVQHNSGDLDTNIDLAEAYLRTGNARAAGRVVARALKHTPGDQRLLRISRRISSASRY